MPFKYVNIPFCFWVWFTFLSNEMISSTNLWMLWSWHKTGFKIKPTKTVWKNKTRNPPKKGHPGHPNNNSKTEEEEEEEPVFHTRFKEAWASQTVSTKTGKADSCWACWTPAWISHSRSSSQPGSHCREWSPSDEEEKDREKPSSRPVHHILQVFDENAVWEEHHVSNVPGLSPRASSCASVSWLLVVQFPLFGPKRS